MADKYKLVVIGAGPGGYVAAIRAAQLGIKTAIVEKEYIGGVCLNWGCIPSKALLYIAELKRTIEECERIGLKAENVGIDLDKLRKHKDDTVKRLTGGVKILLDKAGVKIYNGQAVFASANRIEITSGVHKTEVESDNFIIATGATTADLPILKIDGKTDCRGSRGDRPAAHPGEAWRHRRRTDRCRDGDCLQRSGLQSHRNRASRCRPADARPGNIERRRARL